MHPFRDGDSYSTFQNIIEKTLAEIDGLESEYVLKASPAELEQHFVEKVTLQPLVLDGPNHYIDGQKGTQLDVSHDFRRGRWGQGPVLVKATALDIAVPFTGNPMLWRVRASTYSLSGYPEVEIREGAITFRCTFPDDSPNPQQLKSQIEQTIRSLSEAVDRLANDVSRHNIEAASAVRTALERKLAKSRAAMDAVTALGIPMKKRDVPAAFVVPTKRRSSPVTRPSVATEKYSPEPVLDQREFAHILGVLSSMALVIERSPGSFASLDEEAIRTHFLLQLNGHYEGSATGETFNSSGKTDILIRVKNRNVFVAECKFWRGAKSFGDAVDQLLGYLSWRDSKCALLIFNQTRDSSAVRSKMHEIMIARPEYRKAVSHDPAGDSRYVFVKTDDPGREIQVQTMLFDVPKS